MKIGDKIVCIDNKSINTLIMYNIYTYNGVDPFWSVASDLIKIKEARDSYFSNRFIKLSEYRKLKLKQLNENRR